MKMSSNAPLVRDCAICKMLGESPVKLAIYDLPLVIGGRVTWGYACALHAEDYGATAWYALGTQINTE